MAQLARFRSKNGLFFAKVTEGLTNQGLTLSWNLREINKLSVINKLQRL